MAEQTNPNQPAPQINSEPVNNPQSTPTPQTNATSTENQVPARVKPETSYGTATKGDKQKPETSYGTVAETDRRKPAIKIISE